MPDRLHPAQFGPDLGNARSPLMPSRIGMGARPVNTGPPARSNSNHSVMSRPSADPARVRGACAPPAHGAGGASRRLFGRLAGGDGPETPVPVGRHDMTGRDLHPIRHPAARHPSPASGLPSAADHPACALHEQGNQVGHGRHAGEGPGSMAEIMLRMVEFPRLPEHAVLHTPAGAGTSGRPGRGLSMRAP